MHYNNILDIKIIHLALLPNNHIFIMIHVCYMRVILLIVNLNYYIYDNYIVIINYY